MQSKKPFAIFKGVSVDTSIVPFEFWKMEEAVAMNPAVTNPNTITKTANILLNTYKVYGLFTMFIECRVKR